MKKRVLAIVLAICLAATAGILLLKGFRGQELYVLMYHSVAPDGAECGDWTVTQSRFREQMQWLKDKGYTTVLPSELSHRKPLPRKAVMITFDDGYADNYALAFPVLQEFGHKSVISVVTSYIGNRENFMTWDMCTQLVESGLVEIGSHTHELHVYPGVERLNGETRAAYEERVITDIRRSVAEIEENLGAAPVFFAYPHGIEDPWITEFVAEQFDVSVVTVTGVNRTGEGLYSLLRYNVNDKTQLENYLP